MSPLVDRDPQVAKGEAAFPVGRSCSDSCCHVGGPTKAAAVTSDEEKFSPSGLHVLVVDDDTFCLAVLERMLRQCEYNVTVCTRVSQAISLVKENREGFDIVMSDVYLPGEDGFKLLEVVGIGLGLPVIMMSANGETNVVMRSIRGGACDYLIKPIRTEELRTIWQHVVRRHRQQCHRHDGKDNHGDFSDHGRVLGEFKKRKHSSCQDIKDLNSLKTARVHWTAQLHQRFVKAVNQTGLDNAAPKRILEIMNVPGLTRENVASHLQKYRLYLKRLSGSIPEPRPVASFQAARDGKFGGTMQIRKRGKPTSSSSSSSSSSCALKTSPLSLELSRNVDHATLKSLEQFQAYERKLVANRVQMLRGAATAAAPSSYMRTNVHVDQGYENGGELRIITHAGRLRKNLQGGGGHRAFPADESAAQSFKVDFANLAETKPLTKSFGLSTHQPQFQNPAPTTETPEENDVHKEEAKRLIDETQTIDQEELLFNNFVEENFPHMKIPSDHDQMPTLIASAGDLSEEYFMLGEAFLPRPVDKEEITQVHIP